MPEESASINRQVCMLATLQARQQEPEFVRLKSSQPKVLEGYVQDSSRCRGEYYNSRTCIFLLRELVLSLIATGGVHHCKLRIASCFLCFVTLKCYLQT